MIVTIALSVSSCSGCGGDTTPINDIDSDGIADEVDNCPSIANSDQADLDQDDLGDVCDPDIDGDGIDQGTGANPCIGGSLENCDDNCATDANADQADQDYDGIGDACDLDNNPDSDDDGVLNQDDNCINTPNGDQQNSDSDKHGDACDNCPEDANLDQLDSDSDTFGDACDTCPNDPVAEQTDSDSDGAGDACDNCPQTPNPDQADADSNGTGDACESGIDTDEDGIENNEDNCPFDANADQADNDSDGIGNVCDNCPEIANTDQKDSDQNGTGDACEVSLELNDIFPPAGWRGQDVEITITGVEIDPAVAIIFTNADNPNYSFSPTNITVTSNTTITGIIPLDLSRELGLYDVTATNPDDSTDTLEKAFLVSPNPPPVVDNVEPPFAFNGDPQDGILSDRAISITGSNFVSTPGVRWVYKTDPSQIFEAISVAFTDSTSVTAVIPSESGKMPAGEYYVQLTNPDLQGAQWEGTFEVTATPPPKITGISPIRAAGNDFNSGTVTLTISGSNFVAGAGDQGSQVYFVVDDVDSALTTTADSDTTITAVAGTTTFNNGAYAVKVINPDGQWDIFYAFSVTSSADGKLQDSAGWTEVQESLLQTPRWSHGAAFGFDQFGSGYIYVIGGSDSTPEALRTVEYSQIRTSGKPGVFRYAEQFDGTTHVNNQLNLARTGVAVVRIGPYLYAIAGSDNGATGLTTIEMAKILGLDTVPYLNKHPKQSNVGELPEGSWYYRVSAVGPWGEGLPSQEAIAQNASGSLTIRWAPVTGATSYNIYRSLASDGRSMTEQLLAIGVTDVFFVDTGIDDDQMHLAPAPGNLRGRGSAEAQGSLAVGSWTYRVSAVTAQGETLAGYSLKTEVAMGENAITLYWDRIKSAVSYNIYRTQSVDDQTEKTYLLSNVADGPSPSLIDDGSLGEIDLNTPAPDGVLPLPPGSLSAWAVLEEELQTAREGLRAVDATVSYQEVVDGPYLSKTFIYAAGGRSDPSTPLATIERAEVDMLTGNLSAFVYEPESFNTSRVYFGLLSSQGRLENPVPAGDPPQHCGDVDADGFDDIECGGTDCDDNDSSVYPGASEICDDEIDQDCDGQDAPCSCVDDLDQDGFVSTLACGGIDCCDSGDEDSLGCSLETAATIHQGAAEICDDNIDQNCDGIDENCVCADNDSDGYNDQACGGDDCNDNDPTIHPNAIEICEDSIDQNCDGIDPGCGCPDADGDGFDDENCGGTDCDDTNPDIHPGAFDRCEDFIDQNCDGRDSFCFTGPMRQGDEDIILVATKGDNDFPDPNSLSIETSEICTINEDPSDPLVPVGQLSAWTIQTETVGGNSKELWGHEGLLYINYVFHFAGATSQSATTIATRTQIATNPFDPMATIDLVVDREGSASHPMSFSRAYFSMTRIFSSLIAIGGLGSDGVVTQIESMKQ
jgi:hypothetical protein